MNTEMVLTKSQPYPRNVVHTHGFDRYICTIIHVHARYVTCMLLSLMFLLFMGSWYNQCLQ